MSEGWTATQASLAPKMACSRWKPLRAAHPLPGSRLLHDENVVCMKYGQRVRCNRFPPAVAMLRSCVVAPLRIACDTTGYCVRISGWLATALLVAPASMNTPPSAVAAIARQAEPPQVDQRIGLLDTALHQVEQVGAAREVLGARRGAGGDGVVDVDGVPELEGFHAVRSWATASMAATILA